MIADARSRRSEAGSLVRFARDCQRAWDSPKRLRGERWYRKEDLYIKALSTHVLLQGLKGVPMDNHRLCSRTD